MVGSEEAVIQSRRPSITLRTGSVEVKNLSVALDEEILRPVAPQNDTHQKRVDSVLRWTGGFFLYPAFLGQELYGNSSPGRKNAPQFP